MAELVDQFAADGVSAHVQRRAVLIRNGEGDCVIRRVHFLIFAEGERAGRAGERQRQKAGHIGGDGDLCARTARDLRLGQGKAEVGRGERAGSAAKQQRGDDKRGQGTIEFHAGAPF